VIISEWLVLYTRNLATHNEIVASHKSLCHTVTADLHCDLLYISILMSRGIILSFPTMRPTQPSIPLQLINKDQL